jgi:negative regulator of flagellin synthesis FlgM
MMVEKLGPTDPIQNTQKASQTGKANAQRQSDAVSISAEAVEKGESFQVYELARQAPDVRADKIAELKAKIQDPNYINDTVLSATADKIIEQLLG